MESAKFFPKSATNEFEKLIEITRGLDSNFTLYSSVANGFYTRTGAVRR